MLTATCQTCGTTRELAPYLVKMRIKCKACPDGWLTVGSPVATEPPSAPAVPPPLPAAAETASPPSEVPVAPAAQPVADPRPYRFTIPPPAPPLKPQPDTTATKPSPAARPVVERPESASRGQRFAARLVDVVIGVVAVLLGAFLALAIFGPFEDGFKGFVGRNDRGAVVIFAAFLALSLVTIWLLSVRGQTLGKMLLRIRIVRSDTGGRAGFFRAFVGRDVVAVLLGVIPLVGLIDLLLIFREDCRCLHDHIAGTVVIAVPRSPNAEA